MLGLPRDAVRVTNPDVGGGFGMKAMTYPEYVCIAAAARHLGRPVRWISDRTEAMLTDNAGRDLMAEAEMGFDADLKITAYRVRLVSNLGAYNSQFGQAIQSELFAKVLTGVYDIQTAWLNAVGVFTNTAPRRCLSRRRPARGDLDDRTRDGRGRTAAGRGPRSICGGAISSRAFPIGRRRAN